MAFCYVFTSFLEKRVSEICYHIKAPNEESRGWENLKFDIKKKSVHTVKHKNK